MMTPGMIMFYGKAEVPDGYLLCNGQSVLRATYADLFTIIGTVFGTADGAHFNVPNLAGATVFGVDSSDATFNALGNSGGAKTINVAHTHTMADHYHSLASGSTGTASGNKFQADGSTAAGTDTNHTHSISVMSSDSPTDYGTSSGGSATQSILMRSTTAYPLIKT